MNNHLPKIASSLTVATLLLTTVPAPTAASLSSQTTSQKSEYTLKSFPLSQLTVINDSAIRLGKTHFRINKNQAEFLRTNQQVLKNARLAVRYTENRTIEEFVGIEINQSGSSYDRPSVFDGFNQSFPGIIRINARNISIKNIQSAPYIYLTSKANSTTQLINVRAEKLSQATLPKTVRSQSTALSKIVIQGGSIESIDLQRPNTRLQAKGNAVLNEVRAFANASIQSTAAAHIQEVHTGHRTTNLHLNSNLHSLQNASHRLNLTGKAEIENLNVKTKQANLEIDTYGTIKQVNMNAPDISLSTKGDTIVSEVELHHSGTILASQPIQKVKTHGENTEVNIDATIQELIANNVATITVAKNRKIDALQADANLTVQGEGTVQSLNLNERAKEVVLHIPIGTLNVKGKGTETIHVSGSSTIEHVILDGEAPLNIDVPKIERMEATKEYTGSIDIGDTKVIQNDVIQPEPAPPVVTTPPPVVDPVTPPDDPEEAESTIEDLFEFYKTSIDSDFIVSEDLTIGGFVSEKDMFIYIPKDVTLTVNDTITGGHQIQFMGEGTVNLEGMSLLNEQRVNFEEGINLPVMPEGIFASRKNDIYPEMARTFFEQESLQDAVSNGDIIFVETDITLDAPVRIYKEIQIKSISGSMVRSADSFFDEEAHTYGHLFSIERTEQPVIISGLSFNNKKGGGVRVMGAKNVSMSHVQFIENEKESIALENANLELDYLYTEESGDAAIQIENWFEDHHSSLTLNHSAITDEVAIVTTTDASQISLTVPDEFKKQEQHNQTQWTRQAGIYQLKHNGTTTHHTDITQAVNALENHDYLIVNGSQPLDETLTISKENVLKGEQQGTLTAAVNFVGEDLVQLVGESRSGVIQNLLVEGAPRYGINIIDKGDAVLRNVTSRHNGVGGIIANSSHVTAYDVNTVGNGEFGIGIEVIEQASTRSHFYYETGAINEAIPVMSYSNTDGKNAEFIDFSNTFEKALGDNYTYWRLAGLGM